MAASLGRWTGAVVTQWLIRNSGARLGPRFARQPASSPAGAISAAALPNANGVSTVEPLVGELVPGRGAGAVLRQHDEPPAVVDHLPQRRPLAPLGGVKA